MAVGTMATFPVFDAWAQQEIDYTLHAKFLYHFTKYVEWPEDRRAGNFVVGITGNDELYNTMTRMAQVKKIKGQTMVVLRVKNTDDPSNCHILFVGKSKNAALPGFVLKIGNKSVLVITERTGSIRQGSDINFVINNNNLNFELNSTGASGKRMAVSSELRNLALRNE